MAGAAAVAVASTPLDLVAAPKKKGKAELRLSFQEGIAPGKSLGHRRF